MAFIAPDGTKLIAEGSYEGTILETPRGSGGFGYDPLFYIPSLDKTMAELSVDEKNSISHRGQAIRIMAEKLERYYDQNRGN